MNTIEFKHDMKEGLVSVIIPVYNDVNGIIDTLESLKHQTLSKKEFEIIVINDGGNKEINKIIKKYRAKHICYTPNRGSYFARNRGLESSCGEYIAFVDADIKVTPQWLELGRSLLKKSDYVCGPVEIDATLVKTFSQRHQLETAFPVKEYINKHHFAPTANLFITRQLIESVGGFDENLWSSGDLEFGNRVYTSDNGFVQIFCKDLKVLHPPRDFEGIIKKQKRILEGQKTLHKLYPDRFPSLTKTPKTVLKGFLPPRIFIYRKFIKNNSILTAIVLYILTWIFKIIGTLLIIKGDCKNER